jgi:hypothetical protein
VSLGLQEEHEVNQQQKNKRTRLAMQIGFLLNLGAHLKPPNEPRRRPHLKREDLIKESKINYSTKGGNSSKTIEVLHTKIEGKGKWQGICQKLYQTGKIIGHPNRPFVS